MVVLSKIAMNITAMASGIVSNTLENELPEGTSNGNAGEGRPGGMRPTEWMPGGYKESTNSDSSGGEHLKSRPTPRVEFVFCGVHNNAANYNQQKCTSIC